MDHQEEYMGPSRAEYIKMARESCSKNLAPINLDGKNHNKNYKYNTLDSSKTDSGKSKGLLKNLLIRNNYGISIEGNESVLPLKLFLIRSVCALLLFLIVLLIDKLNVDIKVFNSEYIHELITSSKGLSEAEEYFVSLFKNF